MTYSVHQLAKIAGVSVRTLHHYDEIGLLSPVREKNGYRSYGEAELLRLQQILLFKELEFPLDHIKAMLDRKGFDIEQALHEHKSRIQLKRDQLAGILKTIDKTIAKVTGKEEMTDDELFDAFWEKHEKEYAAEAEKRWGGTDAWKQSQERTKHLTKEDFRKMAKDGDLFMKKLAALIEKGPEDTEVQTMIRQHYESLRTFYDPSPELYRGLADMYVQDTRFRAYYDKYDPRMAEFMREAMILSCDKM